jgi:hypothetical protein
VFTVLLNGVAPMFVGVALSSFAGIVPEKSKLNVSVPPRPVALASVTITK